VEDMRVQFFHSMFAFLLVTKSNLCKFSKYVQIVGTILKHPHFFHRILLFTDHWSNLLFCRRRIKIGQKM